MPLSREWQPILHENAAAYAQVAADNIRREFPAHMSHLMSEPGDSPYRPADRNPVFFGSLDWHSCVEMHWVLVRLLRIAPDIVPAAEIRALLDAQFDPGKLLAEAEFITGSGGRSERPYGWAWALALIHEIADLGDADAIRWLTAIAPLEAAITTGFLAWLLKATYPIRYGVHPNTAFAFSTLLPYARRRSASLADGVTAKALGWFRHDAGWPARFEPSGHDFLSPGLAEAELMARLLPADAFAGWLTDFLPGIEHREPASLFTPAVVSDASEGQIAHLHGLNASRAWCWRRLAESLPADDARIGPAAEAASTHLAAALPHVAGSDYMVEHWLVAYAVLAMS